MFTHNVQYKGSQWCRRIKSDNFLSQRCTLSCDLRHYRLHLGMWAVETCRFAPWYYPTLVLPCTLFECHLRQVKQESSPLEFVNKHRNLASGSASDKEEKHFDQISTKWSHRWCLASSSATSKIRSSQLIWRSEETAAVHRKRIRKEWQQGPNCLDLRHSYTQNLVTLVIEENCTKLISPAPT